MRIAASVDGARLIVELVMRGERGAQRSAGIARRGLNPDVLEMAVAQHLAVGHAVQRDAAGQAEIRHAGFGRERSREPKDHFFERRLDGCRDVHVLLRQRFGRLARRQAEQAMKARVGHRQAGAVIEIIQIQMEGAVGLHVDQVIEDLFGELWLAIGRQAHQLVLARIHLEAGVISERRIEQPERMRKVDFLQDFEPIAAAVSHRSCGPFADAIHGQDRRPPRTAKERRRWRRG